MQKRIGLDCRLAGTKHTGIGRYIVELVPRLIEKAPSDYHWVLFVSDPHLFAGLKNNSHVQFVATNIQHYSFKEQWQLARLFRQAKLDLLHIPHFNQPLLYRRPTILTIHDLLWHQQQGLGVTTLSPLSYYLKYFGYRLVVNQAVKQAETILVPSLKTKRDLLHYYPKTESKIVVSREGVSLNQPPLKPNKLLPKDYLLYVGSLYPHKNVAVLLKALTLAPKENLVIVSARSIFRQKIEKQLQQLKLTHRVIFFDWVSDATLAYLYQKAKALIQPSINEGFGLTGIEAMSFGTPVIASNIAIFQEIYQQAAYFFTPNNYHQLAQIIQKKNLSEKLAQAKTLLGQYSWNQCAQTTLTAYAKSFT